MKSTIAVAPGAPFKVAAAAELTVTAVEELNQDGKRTRVVRLLVDGKAATVTGTPASNSPDHAVRVLETDD